MRPQHSAPQTDPAADEASASPETGAMSVDWPQFLDRHDPLWDELPRRWADGAFLGNGQLGAVAYAQTEVHDSNEAQAESDLNLPPLPVSDDPVVTGLQLFLGRHDLCDIRQDEPDPAFGKCRLPIGKLILRPQGEITEASLRLDLWNAELRGSITTTRGGFELRAFVHATLDVLVIELRRSGEETEASWEWLAFRGSSSRVFYVPNEEYQRNPPPKVGTQRNLYYSVQNLVAGGGYVTAWQELQAQGADYLFLTTAGVHSADVNEGFRVAIENLRGAVDLGWDSLAELHREFWHDYYPQSFLSIPDDRLESFYWIQIYKLAAATRRDKPAMDTLGPWYHFSRRPGPWFNRSMQLAYSPVYTANRLELGESLVQLLKRQANNLVLNADEISQGAYLHDYAGRDLLRPMSEPSHLTESGEISRGNLIWLLHNLYSHCLFSGDEDLTYNLLYPLLRQAMNVYRAVLQQDDAGRLHVPLSQTPGHGQALCDGNFDLALIRWACRTLLRIVTQYEVEDPLADDWQTILNELADSPCDEKTGLHLGDGAPAPQGLRTFAHLLGIYPLGVLRWDNPEQRQIMERSLDHWLSKNSQIDSFGLAMAAAMAAVLHRGDQARGLLLVLLEDFLSANTFSDDTESGISSAGVQKGYSADLGPAFAATAALQEMLLQSTGDLVEIFPAVPGDWQDAVFHRFRAQGGFLVSARRAGGRTAWVQVESPSAGGTFRVRLGSNWKGRPQVTGDPGVIHTLYSRNIVQLQMGPDQKALITPLDVNIQPVPRAEKFPHYWGDHEGE